VRYIANMSSTAARSDDLDPVAAAVANAPEDERPVTEEEAEALREALADPRPFVPHAVVAAMIAERALREG